MFEGIFLIVGFLIGVGVFEEIVVPTAHKANDAIVQPAYEATKEVYNKAAEKVEDYLHDTEETE